MCRGYNTRPAFDRPAGTPARNDRRDGGRGAGGGPAGGPPDVLRGVRRASAAGDPDDEDAAVSFVEEADIPTAGAVAALAAAAGKRAAVWWRELQPLLVA